eukprot:TRINITY_DN12877_c0_g1_i1.p2 TRINITY_DN12877_c0_g1~~TRINITY_DN12877_c0_g1_i1.p2  ORF type:complete len:128 (+),score=51.30 TRINITY_DN12877_c0_g1_i1:35-385(+)
MATAAATVVEATKTVLVEATKTRAVHLYRGIMKAAKQMPTEQRRKWVEFKCRSEFRKFALEKDPETLQFQLLLGETNLDSLHAQIKNFREIQDLISPAAIQKQRDALQRDLPDLFA